VSLAAARHEAARRVGVVPRAPSTIDLHTHTSRSDGLLVPSELVRQAAAVGVRLLAITDHDTLAGVRELTKPTSEGTAPADPLPSGIEVLPGIEINAVVHDRPELTESEVHILGLGVDPDDEALEAALGRQREARRVRFDKMVRRLRELGFDIDAALEQQPRTDDDDALGRPRLARALITLGAATSVEDGFNRWLSRGRPAYVPREGLGPIEAIRAIRQAGGVASLAHFPEALRLRSVVVELREAGLGALEVYYRSFDQATVDLVGSVARDLGLIATGGSDFHGDTETYAEAHAALSVPPSVAPPLRVAMADG
jgi:3',5'-nucleoside bisphosphate phosphatase